MLVTLLKLGDEGSINVMVKDDSVHSLLLEQIDVLSLLNLIGYVVDGVTFRFFVFGRVCIFCLSLFGCFSGSILVLFLLLNRGKKFRKCLVLVVDIFKEDIIIHLIAEFLVF